MTSRMTPNNSTARGQALRDRRREAGMKRFNAWVTPEQYAALKALLDQWEKQE